MNSNLLFKRAFVLFLLAFGLVGVVGCGGGGGGGTIPSNNTTPSVTITAPANGSSFTEIVSVIFTGTATDAEDGNIGSDLSWFSNHDGVIGSGATFATSALSIGIHTITASATDSGGLSGSAAINVTITAVPVNTAPLVTITTPANGSSYSEVATVSFTGTATDAEDGNIGSSLTWRSNRDGVIGSGVTFATSALSVGTHTITASVTDSGGLSGSAAINLTINSLTVATPQITTTNGSLPDSIDVILTTATVGATLYYTIDGSTPTLSATQYTEPFTLTSSATVKAYGVLAGYYDSAMAHAGITVNEGVFLQDDAAPYRFVIIDAANFKTNTARKGFKWNPAFYPGYTGLSAMTTSGYGKVTSSYITDSPQMDYQINFNATGTHYLWLRVQGPAVADIDNPPDIRQHSIHAGIDGQEVDILFAPTGSWTWVEAQSTVTINSTGIYTLSIWMRESLAVIDKILLTTDAAYTPTGNGPVESDQIMCAAPCVRILEPRENHFQSSLNISVSANVTFDDDLHGSWKVNFKMDGGNSRIVASAPFDTVFTNSSKAEHTIQAIVIDSSDQEAVSASNDSVTDIGVGDYYIAFGDSITTGLDDGYLLDNISTDGRNSGGGYAPVLNNLLAVSKGYPQTIQNEGYPGDKSVDGLAIIPEILARYPEAVHFLVEYGTNDAQVSSPVPSGLGCTGAACSGTFKGNMQQVITAIISAGKAVSLAKIPITLQSCSTCPPYPDPDSGEKNIIIKVYNQVIDELVSANGITVTPPDFYSYFLDNYWFEYASWVHPNGTGYRSMADLWQQALTQ